MKEPAEDSTDRELVLYIRKFPADGKLALELLYRRHRSTALKISKCCLASFRLDADHSRDIVHDVFIQLSGKIRSLRDPDRFGGYLSTTVYRATWRFCRTTGRCDSVDPSVLDRIVARGSSIDASTRTELLEVLKNLLNEKEFRILKMSAWDGLSYSEISARESISESTVRWYIGRARNTLRGLIFPGR